MTKKKKKKKLPYLPSLPKFSLLHHCRWSFFVKSGLKVNLHNIIIESRYLTETLCYTSINFQSPSSQIHKPNNNNMSNQDNSLQVFCIGTADTKLDELRFLSESVHSSLRSFSTSSSFKVHYSIPQHKLYNFYTPISVLSYNVCKIRIQCLRLDRIYILLKLGNFCWQNQQSNYSNYYTWILYSTESAAW